MPPRAARQRLDAGTHVSPQRAPRVRSAPSVRSARCFAPTPYRPPCMCTAVPLQETLKSVVAQYNASQLLTMREVRRGGARC